MTDPKAKKGRLTNVESTYSKQLSIGLSAHEIMTVARQKSTVIQPVPEVEYESESDMDTGNLGNSFKRATSGKTKSGDQDALN